ncbi:hypothetical protein [Mesorhizobium sp. WSM3224]|uniref:hypothetical protein n=1 Tax=Mesorhizobium sp. WSM3224 TaxID=1040986 RepID=UPI00048261AA|nr:hypothetical protein [Mesorhizobium sp. WSM3224]
MKRLVLILVTTCSVLAGPALAACPSNSAGTDQTRTAGISKDGTRAPLQPPAPQVDKKAAQKDGSTMPLASQAGAGNKNLATSQQDVEAQQQGGKTAAAQADENCKTK